MTAISDLPRDAKKSVLCWLSTVGADGQPNVSPKEIWEIETDGMLKVADIESPKSVRNIFENPKVCVGFADVFSQRGFKIVGLAAARITARCQKPTFPRENGSKLSSGTTYEVCDSSSQCCRSPPEQNELWKLCLAARGSLRESIQFGLIAAQFFKQALARCSFGRNLRVEIVKNRLSFVY